MEENKTKTVKMEVSKNQNINKKEDNKLTSEQLEAIATQLMQDNNKLKAQVQELTTLVTYKKIDFLFRVIENKEAFDSKFVNSCAGEITDALSKEEDIETDKKD